MKNKKLNKKRLITLIIVAILVIVIAIFIIFQINKALYRSKYKEYSLKVEQLGLDSLYLSGKANDYKYVTYAEAVAIISKAGMNIDNIEQYGYEEKYGNVNSPYIQFAEINEIIPELMVDENNINDKITRLETLKMFGNLKTKILDRSLDIEDVKLRINNAHKLETYELDYLKDAVKNGVFENSGSISQKTKIRRGEFNKAICEFISTNSVITAGLGDIETDENNIPSNADKYPFTLKGYDKAIYEKPMSNETKEEFQDPKYLFEYLQNTNVDTVEKLTNYFNQVLNVNYETIDEEVMKEKISENLMYDRNIELIDSYVEYVKENKLVVEGNSKVYMPVVYYDGLDYRVRVELKFNVISGDTLNNVLLGDDIYGETFEYQKENSIVVDYPLENQPQTGNLYPIIESIMSHKID